MEESSRNQDEKNLPESTTDSPLPIVRSGVGGVLMGLANLVPGVSGGTMIVVMGLYDDFIESVADVTRLRFTKRNVTFLAIVGMSALIAIVALSGTLVRAVTLHRSAMFSLFIGMTLGGAPLLFKMLGRINTQAVAGMLVGLAAMIGIAASQEEPPDKETIVEAIKKGEFEIEPNYMRDGVAGVLGMSAMVLPGISGAYMLLILGRYETIFAAIAMAKSYALSSGDKGDIGQILGVIIPTAIGSILSIVCLSNLLKWFLRERRDLTVGTLLGILLGSVIGIWPFGESSVSADYMLGAGLAAAGFIATLFLSRLSA